MPGEQVQPELIFEARALGEVGQVSTDGVGKSGEERGIPVRLDGDARGDGPAEQGQKVDSGIRLQPVVVEGLGLAVVNIRRGGVRELRTWGEALRADNNRGGKGHQVGSQVGTHATVFTARQDTALRMVARGRETALPWIPETGKRRERR